jgi:uncharacterized protein involved in exopolysaccharide biosynthesis
MLQKPNFDDTRGQAPNDADEPPPNASRLLRPSYYWQVFRRRALYFLLPFILISTVGITAARLWPATYRSEARILVQAQQIPTDLVRATVASASQGRLQVLEQRTMTRDNLLGIVDKFQLFPNQRGLLSPTQLVDLMKQNTQIKPIDEPLLFDQLRRGGDNPTIIFTVSFDYSDPAIATAVTSALVTRLLDEDLRDRMTHASEATQFLAREVDKLQSEATNLDAKIARIKVAQKRAARNVPLVAADTGANSSAATRLAQLKLELAQKSTLYSDSHPAIRVLKGQIAALQATVAAQPPAQEAPRQGGTTISEEDEVSLATLEARQETLQKSLADASAKLSAARMGELLEKDRQAEKLEVIEQPTTPREAIKPNRGRLALLSLLVAFAIGAGLVFLLEITDKAIRRTDELHQFIDSRLVVTIPYILTKSELLRRRIKIGMVVAAMVVLLPMAGMLASRFLPSLDLMIAKVRVGMPTR